MTSDLFEFAPNSESKAMARIEQGKTILWRSHVLV